MRFRYVAVFAATSILGTDRVSASRRRTIARSSGCLDRAQVHAFDFPLMSPDSRLPSLEWDEPFAVTPVAIEPGSKCERRAKPMARYLPERLSGANAGNAANQSVTISQLRPCGGRFDRLQIPANEFLLYLPKSIETRHCFLTQVATLCERNGNAIAIGFLR
jgi:hypothetical protein